ncbi:MAG: CRISPR-associated helicase Cas3' [Gammaproteobacteria bacterium]|nr:CRISPR-associated helicase Cas3' [Gammaproteobacteria bacterium]
MIHYEDSKLRYPLWGKAGKRDKIPADRHGALPAHMLAVAACFSVLIEERRNRAILCRLWPGQEPPLKLLAWVAAMHDLGKAHCWFQAKRPDVVAEILGIDEHEVPKAKPYYHGSTGFHTFHKDLLDELQSRFNLNRQERRTLDGLLSAACAHHGFYPRAKEEEEADGKASPDHFAQTMINRLAEDFEQMLDGPFVVSPLKQHAVSAAHWLAGWISLADWLGSDEKTFEPINCREFDLHYGTPQAMRTLFEKYREYARQRISDLGIFKPAFAGADQPVNIYDAVMRDEKTGEIYPARPLQQWILDRLHPKDGAHLLLLEAPMGNGKTEAALLAAGRFIAGKSAHGLAFALPTQASTNQIYKRLKNFSNALFKLFPGLTHGDAKLWLQGQSARQETETGEESACHLDEWITDTGKKAFLAPVSAVTIDQMQLAAMHSKHGFLRAAALARQVTVIDEIHAYDAYMREILDSLLQYLGAVGTPVILLSATLPPGIRIRLLRAYCQGADIPFAPDALGKEVYPLVTEVTALKSIQQYDTPGKADAPRQVIVECLSASEAQNRAIAAAQAGGCVCLLCNTVKSALARYTELHDRKDIRVDLLHARFRWQDRRIIEEGFDETGEKVRTGVIDYAGKESNPEIRRGRLLIATQVVEQSLDLDFDLLVTEVAPIDLIMQRVGRLHRHDRKRPASELNRPRLIVIVPEADADDKAWFEGTQLIYKNGEKLEPSIQWLKDNPSFTLPYDIPVAVKAVYASEEVYTKGERRQAAGANPCIINHKNFMHNLTQGAVRSYATRSGDGREDILLVVEDDENNLCIPFTKTGGKPLPAMLDDLGKLNERFLLEAHPWLLSVDKARVWRKYANCVKEQQFPNKYMYPPFHVVICRRKRGCLHIAGNLWYSTDRGLYEDDGDA